jgi:hypothetical protein
MTSLYWLIAGLGALVLLVLAVAVADVLRTAGRGRVDGTPHANRSETGPTGTPAVLPSETVQRLNGEAYTQPLYRPHRRRRSSSRGPAEANGAEPASE